MSETESIEPISDDELLFRRIPASTGWYESSRNPPLQPEAFRPNKNDTTGISLFREKFVTMTDAAQGRPGKSYYIAVLRAGDIRKAGMDIVARPVENAPGHAEIPELTYDQRKSKRAIEWRSALAEIICLRVEGPFES